MFFALAAAGAQDAAPATPPVPAPEAVPVPDAELLLFLAEFGDGQGEFADPAEVAGAIDRAESGDPDPAADHSEDHDDEPADPPR